MIVDYLETLTEENKTYSSNIVSLMSERYAQLIPTLSYQMPMYRVGMIKLHFAGAKNHFGIYTTDFEFVEKLKEQSTLPLKYSKSGILFPYQTTTFEDVKQVVLMLVEKNFVLGNCNER